MLPANRRAHPGCHLERFGVVGMRFDDVAGAARKAQQARMEAAARCGSFEILFDASGREIYSDWSSGIYHLVGRSLHAGPVSREAFVLAYVHAEDQARIFEAEIPEKTPLSALRYRLISDEGATVEVIERITEVVETTAGRLVFATLHDVRVEHAAYRSPQPIPARMPGICDDAPPRMTQTTQATIGTVDRMIADERRRVARDIHDDFGQLLGLLKIDLTLLQASITPASPLSRKVRDLQELADAMMVSMRRILANLPARAVAVDGLASAVEQLIEALRKRHPIKFSTCLEFHQQKLPMGMAQSIYRVVQEALNNIVRHAEAAHVHITCDTNDHCLNLQISDDGKGVSEGDLHKVASYGLLWMRERVIGLQGRISLSRREPHGTVLDIQIPLSPSPTGNGHQ